MQTALFFSGVTVGLFAGAILWEVLVAGPSYLRSCEREWRLNERVRAWQRMALVEYAATQKRETARALDAFTDNVQHSVKVPDLKAVR